MTGTWQETIAIGIVAIAALYLAMRVLRAVSGTRSGGCGSSSSGCGSCPQSTGSQTIGPRLVSLQPPSQNAARTLVSRSEDVSRRDAKSAALQRR